MAKKIEVDLVELEALAGRGYNITMCCDAIGISQSKAFRDSQIMQAIKRGHSTAKQKVVDDLMSRSEADVSSTASIFLAKSLKVFDEYYATAAPKSPQDAVNKISSIFVAVSQNKLSQEKGTHLVGYLEKYLKAYDITEVNRRLDLLEEVALEQQK